MIEWIVRKILFASLEPQVLVVGMKGSGKRTFEQLLHPPGGGGIAPKSIFTGSPNQIYTFNQDGVDFSLSSYGGNASMIWHADRGNAGVICVVDSSDEAKIEMTKVAMEWFFERYERLLRKAVLLVLANKQDRLNALSVTEVKERLELETRFEGRRWHIQGIDAVSGLGVKEGLDWMTRQI